MNIKLVVVFVLVVTGVGSSWAYIQSSKQKTINTTEATSKPPPNITKHKHKWNELTFIEHMIPHHEEAIDQSRIMLDKVSNQRYRLLLENIIEVQSSEVESMKKWYNIWSGNDYSSKGVYEPMMSGLDSYDGKLLEREWLQSMIYHHQAAIYMSISGLETVGKPDLRNLMESIKQTQSAQIVDMEQMIDINRAENAQK